jgi:hypothetical protein
MGVPNVGDMSAASTTALGASFVGFGGLLTWAVPSLVLTVPGLLALAIGAQLAGGLAWLPIVSRSLGGFGLASRRRRDQERAAGAKGPVDRAA